VTEIKHKITNLLNSVNDGQIAYDELELILEYVINNDVSKDEAFSFLEKVIQILVRNQSRKKKFGLERKAGTRLQAYYDDKK